MMNVINREKNYNCYNAGRINIFNNIIVLILHFIFPNVSVYLYSVQNLRTVYIYSHFNF